MAAPKIVHTLFGAKELEAELLALARRYGNETLRNPLADAMYHALEPVEQQIRATTPVRQGRLKRKIYRERFTGKQYDLLAGTGYRFRGKADTSSAIGANVLEFGSPTVRARRMLRNAFEQNRSKSMRIFFERFNRDFELQLKK